MLRDPVLADLYTVTAQNKYEVLCQDGESITETYAHLIKANEQAAKEQLPVKKKTRKKKVNSDIRITNARKKWRMHLMHTVEEQQD